PKPEPGPKVKDIHAPRDDVSEADLMQMDLGPEIVTHAGVNYSDDASITRQLDVYAPKTFNGKELSATNTLPVLVFYHGGNWAAFGGDKRHGKAIASGLCKEGFIVVSITYRGADGTEESQYPRFVRDAAHGFAWVHKNVSKYHGNPERIFISGHSAGGHIAALLAYDSQWLKAHEIDASKTIRGMVGISGIYYIPNSTDSQQFRQVARMLDFPFPVDRDSRRQASPISHVDAGDPPSLLLYGDEDYEHLDTVALGAWVSLRAMGVEASHHMVEGQDHVNMLKNFGVRENVTTAKTLAFLKARLKALGNG
ncbi:MAG: alpha/beta hydrolase, partial [Planctomycetes bacterium]|nr:alpha/beta hydrolase [Planctomycetota bacterium]